MERNRRNTSNSLHPESICNALRQYQYLCPMDGEGIYRDLLQQRRYRICINRFAELHVWHLSNNLVRNGWNDDSCWIHLWWLGDDGDRNNSPYNAYSNCKSDVARYLDTTCIQYCIQRKYINIRIDDQSLDDLRNSQGAHRQCVFKDRL